MWPLSGTLEQLEPRLAPLLASATGRARVLEIARLLPAHLSHCVFFEFWLRAGSPRVDLIVRIGAHGRTLLADPALATLPERLRAQPEWQQVAAFARAWARPGSLLERQVEGIWLEFDLEPTLAHGADPVPRVFVDFSREARQQASPAARLELAVATLRPLGRELDAQAAARLRTCLERLPAGVSVLYLGLVLTGSSPSLRVCVQGPRRELLAYLAAAGWAGDAEDLGAQILRPFDVARDEDDRGVSILHLDVGAEVAPKIGLEYAFARAGQPRGHLVETAFLDHLVARGWCLPDKRDELLRWPGRSVELLPHEVWHSHVTRRLSHVKVAYATGQPVDVKAYACFFHELLPGGTLVGSRPVFFGQPRPAPLEAPAGAPALSNRAPARSRPGAPSATPLSTLAPAPVATRATRGTHLALVGLNPVGGLLMLMSTAERNALETILERATVDRAFRQGLLTDPRHAIHDAFGVKIPHNFRVKFIEKGRDVDALVVLPDFQAANGELCDEDLDNVAGGGTPPLPPDWADGIGG